MSEANKKLFQRWMQDVWNEGREATIDELCAPDVVGYGLGDVDPVLHGPAGFKVFWRNLRGALSDLRMTVDDVVAEDDHVIGRIVLEGVHSGDTLGVPASRRKVRVAGIIWLRIGEGRIVEAWNSWDQLGLLRQIGALASPNQDQFMTART